MAECVFAYDGLVVLNGEPRDVGNELRSAREHCRVYAGGEQHAIAAHPERHHDLFQRRIAGPLPDAVYSALDLPRARDHSCQRVCNSEPKIIMAMSREDDISRAWHAVSQHFDDLDIF